MQKVILLIFLLISLISAVDSSIVDNQFTSVGRGSVMRNTDIDWNSEVGDGYVGGSSGSVLLTAPGDYQYQILDKIDATVNNRYNSTQYTKFGNGGVGSDTLSMSSNSPPQTATVDHSWILQSAEIDSSKFVNDANLSMGQDARWDGVGLYTRDINYRVFVSGSKGLDKVRYTLDGNDHGVVATNATGGSETRPEFSFTDFQDSFIAKDTINLTTNESVNKS